MLCDRCKTNEATVLYEATINGKAASYRLCPVCYAEMFSSFNNTVNKDILAGLLGSNTKRRKTECPTCGMKYSEFERTGLLGCPACYDFFKDELTPYIERIQGKVKHVGKAGNINGGEQELTSELKALQEKLEKAIREKKSGEAQKIYKEMADVISRMPGKEED